MARTKEYQSSGGAYKKLEDALSCIDTLLEEVKKAGTESDIVHSEVRALRNVVGRMQELFLKTLASLRETWREMGLDPVLFTAQESISSAKYVHRIQFFHPVYDHVWVTDIHGNDLSEELNPHIVFETSYIHKQNKVVANIQMLEVQLNLPDFKTSLEAAYMDLEILRHDAKHVEQVTEFGNTARAKLTEALQEFCQNSELSVEVNELAVEEIISSGVFVERERARKRTVKEEAPSQEEEAAKLKKAREEEAAAEARRLELEERKQRLAQERAEQEERQREQERLEKEAAKAAAAKDAERKAAEEAAGSAAASGQSERRTVRQGSVPPPRVTPVPPSMPVTPAVAASSSSAPTPHTPNGAGQSGTYPPVYTGLTAAPAPPSMPRQSSVPPPLPMKKPTDPIY